MSTQNQGPKTSSEIKSPPAAKPSGGGSNIKTRLMTAGILIPMVILAASFPQGWFLFNLCKVIIFKRIKPLNAVKINCPSEILLILLVFPMLVLIEYSSMMGKILEYVNSLARGPSKFDEGNDSKKDESLQQVLLHELIRKVNKNWVTAIWEVLIHLSVIIFNPIHT